MSPEQARDEIESRRKGLRAIKSECSTQIRKLSARFDKFNVYNLDEVISRDRNSSVSDRRRSVEDCERGFIDNRQVGSRSIVLDFAVAAFKWFSYNILYT
jgi:hypothetical protein